MPESYWKEIGRLNAEIWKRSSPIKRSNVERALGVRGRENFWLNDEDETLTQWLGAKVLTLRTTRLTRHELVSVDPRSEGLNADGRETDITVGAM